MEKIKTSLFFLLVVAVSSSRQNDEEEITFLQDSILKTVAASNKSPDSINVTNYSNEIYSGSLVLDENPKIPPRK